MAESQHNDIYYLSIKQLNGRTLTLKFQTPILSYQTLISRIASVPNLPPLNDLLLLSQSRRVCHSTHLVADESRLFPIVTLSARLLGGKGGFGSLLRGAATKAGQKKTNNFDACRDMSGRRLRHVNAEKKLEEWKEEEEERKLEKLAADFLKKKAKEAKRNGKETSDEKYLKECRLECEKNAERVRKAVREVVERKRKETGKDESEAKRFKIWLGKSKLVASDDDMDSSDDEEEKGKSIVINNESPEGSSKDAQGQGSPVSVSNVKFDGETSGGGSCESEAEDGKVECAAGSSQSSGSPVGSSNHGNKIDEHVLEAVLPQRPASEVESKDADDDKTAEAIDRVSSVFLSEGGKNEEHGAVHSDTKDKIEEEKDTPSIVAHPEKPFTFDDYNSASELEVLGMDRLKSELQVCGLKCGGTLQERAARLFMLKSTPLDKLPKKLLAKK